ncbi:hypothetical protein Dimus_039469 [Dionaea muscipula]
MWDSLRDFGLWKNQPWLLIRDFNCVSDPSERMNGAPVHHHEIADFAQFKHDAGMIDIPSQGPWFTWTNNHTWCKLDRALVNQEWFNLDQNSNAIFAPIGLFSDHSACFIKLFNGPQVGSKPFKYLNL